VYLLALSEEMCRKEIYEAKYPESRAGVKRLKELKQYRSEIVSSRENAQSARAQCCGNDFRNVYRRYCFQNWCITSLRAKRCAEKRYMKLNIQKAEQK